MVPGTPHSCSTAETTSHKQDESGLGAQIFTMKRRCLVTKAKADVALLADSAIQQFMIKSAALAILTCILLRGQTSAPRTEFEVATVKLSPSGKGVPRVHCTGGPGTADPGLYNCTDITLSNLVVLAFALDPSYQLDGLEFADPVRYTVAARIPAGATREQFNRMLQNLLIERLKLKFHYEKKEILTYNLVVAKGGLKMKESPADAAGAPSSGMRRVDSGQRWTAHAIGMDWIARRLSNELGAPVTDSTGLKGVYDFVLNWTPENGKAAAADSGPLLEDAVQEQLGLKLERKKGTADVFVIDHAEKTPVEN